MSTTTYTSDHRAQAEMQESIVTRPLARKVLAVARVVIGFTFLWAFVDKLFGFGFATPSSRAWINGGTPARGHQGHRRPVPRRLPGLRQPVR